MIKNLSTAANVSQDVAQTQPKKKDFWQIYLPVFTIAQLATKIRLAT